MKRIGLTGGIGAGKSIVAEILLTMGYPVFFSDKVGKELMISNQDVKNSVSELFGKQAYLNGELNRSWIAKKIFKENTLKEKLNAIIHPAVRKSFDEWASQQKSPLVFNEAAILFETGSYTSFDATILVTADEEVRIERTMKRDNISREQVISRIKNQWSDEKKKTLADELIVNDKNTLLIPQVELILKHLLT
jgi:dephospho-CoA kinase